MRTLTLLFRAALTALGFGLLACLPLTASAQTNLVTDGGFESGNFAGWTHSTTTLFLHLQNFTDPRLAPTHSGNGVAVFAC